MFSEEKLQEIVKRKIEQEEKLGEETGGSGHLGYKSYEIDEISSPTPVKTSSGDGWAISYSYTIYVTTEFTYYPDNPPYEYKHRKNIIVDQNGETIEDKVE